MGKLLLALVMIVAIAEIVRTNARELPRRSELGSASLDIDNSAEFRSKRSDASGSQDSGSSAKSGKSEKSGKSGKPDNNPNDECVNVGDSCRNGEGICLMLPNGLVCV